MPTAREVKKRIRSVKNIGQITRALEAVSASRVRKAQQRVLASRAYAEKNETLKVEIVTNGSGIKLFRADTSPLQEPLAALRQNIPDVTYTVCDAALKIAEQKEGKSIPLIPGAGLVPLGIGRVVELQETGWSYIHG